MAVESQKKRCCQATARGNVFAPKHNATDCGGSSRAKRQLFDESKLLRIVGCSLSLGPPRTLSSRADKTHRTSSTGKPIERTVDEHHLLIGKVARLRGIILWGTAHRFIVLYSSKVEAVVVCYCLKAYNYGPLSKSVLWRLDNFVFLTVPCHTLNSGLPTLPTR